MRREVFRGADATAAMRQALAVLGDDAVVLRSTTRPDAPPDARVEIVAATAGAVERWRARVTPGPLPLLADRGGPLVLLFVGPTGAGKAAAAARLAAHASLPAVARAGVLVAAGGPVAAGARLRRYATEWRVPCETVHAAAEVPAALARLAHCDLVLAVIPGPARARAHVARATAEIARALAPREVHLVVPASIRADVAVDARLAAPLPPTHALLTKLDEVPDERGVPELVTRLALPVRWVTDDPDAPEGIHDGPPRLVAALGVPPLEAR